MKLINRDDLISKWVEALKTETIDGQHIRQAKGCLFSSLAGPDEDAYCCLGVLCELAEKEGINVDLDYQGILRPWKEGEVLPKNLVNLLGTIPTGKFLFSEEEFVSLPETKFKGTLKERYGYGYDDYDVSLAYLNDHCGFTFPEIAEVIEKYGSTNLFDKVVNHGA